MLNKFLYFAQKEHVLTHKLFLNQNHVVDEGLESFDVATAEYSKIRVTGFARSGSNTNVDVVIRMTDPKDNSTYLK